MNNGTEIKVKGYWNGFDGDIVLWAAGSKKKGLYIKKKKDTTKNRISQMEQASDTFDITLQKAI